MIKKTLLGLGITILSFISFSSAIDLSKTFQNGSYNNIVSDIDVAVYNRGMLASNRLGNVKRMIAFGSYSSDTLIQRKYFWWNNGLPYFYFYYSNGRTTKKLSGIFKRYYICNSITSASNSSTSVSNCNSDEWGDGNFASDFFNSITASDYRGYKNTTNSSSAFNICFSSASYGKSICFEALEDSSNFFTSVSMDSNIDYVDFPNSLLGDPPGRSTSGGGNGGNIDGGSSEVINGSLTGDVNYSVCSKQKALTYYNVNGYSTKLCYSSYSNNSDIYNGPSSVSNYALTGTDILDVWFDTRSLRRFGQTGTDFSYEDWFHYRRNTFEKYNISYNSSGSLSNPFVGVPVSLYTLFGNIYSYGVAYKENTILEYCDLALYTPKNELQGVYSGVLGTLPCNYSAIDILADSVGVHAGPSGHIVQGSSWEGVLNRSGYSLHLAFSGGIQSSGSDLSGLSYYSDGSTFINDTFNSIQSKFRFPDGVGIVGIIPNYILVFLVALILFRFLSH